MNGRKDTFLELNIEPSGFSTAFDEDDLRDTRSSRLARAFAESKYRTLYGLAFSDPEGWFSPSLAYVHSVSAEFVRQLVRTPDIAEMRGEVVFEADRDAASDIAARIPFIRGSDYVNTEWVLTLWDHLLLEFRFDVRSFEGTIQEYFAGKNDALRTPGRIFFHLVEDTVNKSFAFVASYSSVRDGVVRHHPLSHALKEYSGDRARLLRLLSDLEKVADGSELISSLITSGELFHPLEFSQDMAYTFLKEVPVYEDAGIICRIPDWWRKRSKAMNIGLKIEGNPSLFSAESLLSLSPVVSVDGEELTPQEIRELVESAHGLAFVKGRWIEADRDRLKAALDLFENESGRISISEAMRMAAGIDPAPVEGMSITNGEWLTEMFRRMREADFEDEPLPETFRGTLRPYQMRGYSWLCNLRRMGFGACLADDMGLGKTVQVIAYLESLRARGPGRHLLVVPASLMGNWSREIAKFAPDMPFSIFHGPGTQLDPGMFLTITTYGLVRSRPELTATEWDTVILDEAQAIKNPQSSQSRAVRSLKGYRLAMTGTPVENGLFDMWTLFDFIERGLLGTVSEFKGFAQRISGDPDGYAKLRGMTAPFILRRLKTDSRIIEDLPEKTEMDVPVALTRKQEVLYREYMDDFARRLSAADATSRRGLILGAITKFKQICDHPDLFLGLDSYEEGDGGKFAQMRQICENIRDSGERVLVFTQYREMTAPLATFLEGVFGRRGFVLHGGTTLKDRNDMVRRFNDRDEYIPFMVLSLKAGGVGLNLTAANHVIHFDRWWNPAVENQATDRAFRIGQTRGVMVYRMVSQGTIEEKVSETIERKRDLADMVVGSGEGWITEMDDGEVLNMFRLEW